MSSKTTAPSQLWQTDQCAAASGVRDEGRPSPSACRSGGKPPYAKRIKSPGRSIRKRRHKASGMEKQEGEHTNCRPWRRKLSDGTQTGECEVAPRSIWTRPCLRARWCPGIEAAPACSWLYKRTAGTFDGAHVEAKGASPKGEADSSNASRQGTEPLVAVLKPL